MTVGDGQKFLGPSRQPLVTLPAVALGAVPVAARLVFDHFMGTVIALLNELAERGSAARADIPEGLPLLGRQHVSPAVQELLPVLTEDIGDFQSVLVHRCRTLSWERSLGRN
jgi:hypothetical protein